MIDDRTMELINRELDNELSEPEQIELNEYLVRSESARHYQTNLKSLDTLVDNLPTPALPDGLHETIVGGISLAKCSAPKSSIPNQRPGLARFGLATAAGLLLALGVYQFGSQMDPTDTDQMTGTIAPGHDNAVVLGRYSVDTDELSSSVRLERRGADFVMHVDLDAVLPVDLAIDLAESNLRFKAMAQASSDLEVFHSADQVIHISGRGQHEFTVLLSRDGETGTAIKTIALEYSSNGKLIRHAELIPRSE